jgi:hypothetical protein
MEHHAHTWAVTGMCTRLVTHLGTGTCAPSAFHPPARISMFVGVAVVAVVDDVNDDDYDDDDDDDDEEGEGKKV